MEYQHYIGEGPEATAILDTLGALREAMRDAVLAFEKRHGFTASWSSRNALGGPLFKKKLAKNVARDLGLKLAGSNEDGFCYEPNRGSKMGKEIAATLDEANKSFCDPSKHIVKATGMGRTLLGGRMIAHTAAGHVDGKIVVKVPIGAKLDPQNDPMPTPPPWLREAKESEVGNTLGNSWLFQIMHEASGNSRAIGTACPRSATISPMARSCAAVIVNGNRRRMCSSTLGLTGIAGAS